MDRGAQQIQFVGNRLFVGVHGHPRAPCRHAKRFGCHRPGQPELTDGDFQFDPRNQIFDPYPAGRRMVGGRVGVAAGADTGPGVMPGGETGQRLDGGTRADNSPIGRGIVDFDAQGEAHGVQPCGQWSGIGSLHQEPGRLAIVDDVAGVFDASLHGEQECFGAFSRSQAEQQLTREGVQPRQPVDTGDGDDPVM